MLTSPPSDERPPKRQKVSQVLSKTEMTAAPENIVDIVPDGDVLVVINDLAGVKKQIGLRASSHVLGITSPVFKTLLASTATAPKKEDDGRPPPTLLPLLEEDGQAMLLLCNILHLRNNALPTFLSVDVLYKLAALADKFQCAVAAGRATTPWFEIIHAQKLLTGHFRLVEAAYLLDEPIYFARFTERFIVCEPISSKFVCPASEGIVVRRLAVELHNRRIALVAALRSALDLLVDPCTAGFANQHHIDWMSGMLRDDDGAKLDQYCRADLAAGAAFLGALHKGRVYPATKWRATLQEIAADVREFVIPDWDEQFAGCEFCEDVRTAFEKMVPVVKDVVRKMFWGLCLDCFKAGTPDRSKPCRYEHSKPDD